MKYVHDPVLMIYHRPGMSRAEIQRYLVLGHLIPGYVITYAQLANQ
jgi:hypothetical protein